MGYDVAATDDSTAIIGPPAGPDVAAFFDLDGTLIDGFSAAVLYRHRLRDLDVGLPELLALAGAATGDPLDEDGFEQLLTTAVAGWQGRPRADYDAWGERMAREEITAMLFHQAWRRVKAHQRQGHTVVVATSATRFQAAPLARELGIDHVLCTELEEDDDELLTGRLAGRTGWGEGKAALVTRFAAENGIDLTKSWAYANGAEDVPFLETVGRPHAVNPEQALAEVAAARDWPVLTFSRPAASSWDPRPLLRTAAVYGSFFLSSGIGRRSSSSTTRARWSTSWSRHVCCAPASPPSPRPRSARPRSSAGCWPRPTSPSSSGTAPVVARRSTGRSSGCAPGPR
jgi:putative phosphoserine phosphatase/1-acylglycerol-3-phosphate O-acyltransferase